MNKKITDLYVNTKKANDEYRAKVEAVNNKLSELSVKREDLKKKSVAADRVEDFKKLKSELSDINEEIDFFKARREGLVKKEAAAYPEEWRTITSAYEDRKTELAEAVAKQCMAIVKLFDEANADADTMRECVAEIGELYNVSADRPMIANYANPTVGGFGNLYRIAKGWAERR